MAELPFFEIWFHSAFSSIALISILKNCEWELKENCCRVQVRIGPALGRHREDDLWALGNYNSFDGVLYCRPHFDQIFKRTGSLEKSFEGTPKVIKPEKHADTEKPMNKKVASAFVGTREKCVGCNKTVYPTERVTVNGTPYHKICFKCTYGGCVISPSNYIAHEGKLYCKHHHIQLIKEKGNLSQLENEHSKIVEEAGVSAAATET